MRIYERVRMEYAMYDRFAARLNEAAVKAAERREKRARRTKRWDADHAGQKLTVLFDRACMQGCVESDDRGEMADATADALICGPLQWSWLRLLDLVIFKLRTPGLRWVVELSAIAPR